MEGKSNTHSMQQTLEYMLRKTIPLVQERLDCGLEEPETEPKTTTMTLLNETFFKKGFLKRDITSNIISAREEIIKNKIIVLFFTPAEETVFSLEKQIKEENVKAEKLVENLWYPFRKHNLEKESMKKLIKKARKELSNKGRVILPSELITLAALNKIDSYLEKPNTSNKFFKTRVLNELEVGRRASATRELKRKGYIEQFGNRWKRTEKEFDEADFSPKLAE